MIDMKLTPEQSQAQTFLGVEDAGDVLPAYPEGLKISIEGDALKRLAIGEGNLPAVGTKLLLNALVEVVEVCKEEGAIDSEYCVELQITSMELVSNEPKLNPQQAAYAQVGSMYG